MTTLIFGDGHLGQAIAAQIGARGEPAPTVLGRPPEGRHAPARLVGVDLAYDASRADAVGTNIATALAGGCRDFVIATTGWDEGRAALEAALRDHDAAAVAAPNFSLGVAGLLRLVDLAGSVFARVQGFDAYVLEWHRRGKADRPSGTAREIARRLLAVDPRKRAIAVSNGSPPAADELEVVSLRAGASPGMHVVGFDAPGDLASRARGPIGLAAAVPLEDVRVEPTDAGAQRAGEVDEPEKARDAQAEVRRRDGRRVVVPQCVFERAAAIVPTGRGDHEAPAATREGGCDVRADRVRPRGVEGEINTDELRGCMPAVGRAPEHGRSRITARADLRGNRLAQVPISEDEHCHRVGPLTAPGLESSFA